MPTYTVHAPPPNKGKSDPDRFLFVRDGFHFWAFLLGPLWLLVHRLWLVFIGYLVLSAAVGGGVRFLGVQESVGWVVGLIIALLLGFEAPTLWRWTLARRGWKSLGFVVGEDAEAAEQRFYAAWTAHAGEVPAPPPATPAPSYAMPQRGPGAPSDVIGLFPEPGGPR
jgi:hypothetical protein